SLSSVTHSSRPIHCESPSIFSDLSIVTQSNFLACHCQPDKQITTGLVIHPEPRSQASTTRVAVSPCLTSSITEMTAKFTGHFPSEMFSLGTREDASRPTFDFRFTLTSPCLSPDLGWPRERDNENFENDISIS
ncbi:hypothetical protein PFISCL1PPCAC_25803, partial [Pristionchus fissidentatus]